MVVQRKLMPSATRGSIEPSCSVTNGRRRPMKVFADPAALGMLEKFAGSIGDSHRPLLSIKSDLVQKTNPGAVVHGTKTDLSYTTDQPTPQSDGVVTTQHSITDECRDHLNDVDQKLNGKTSENSLISSCEEENSSEMAHQVLKYSQSDVNRMRKEWRVAATAELESYRCKLGSQLQVANDRILQLTRSNQQMSDVLKEYNKTLSDMAAVKETSKKENEASLAELTKARDQAFEDTQAVERAFSDLHRRFEKTKSAVVNLHKNEHSLKQTISQYENKFIEQEDRYDDLLKQAQQKLVSYHSKLEQNRKANECEIARLKASLKKAELRNNGLEQSLQQKTNEIAELTKICDDLISRTAGDA